jgi:ABC-type Fe3+-hydroxamate transport system substrate-binding protein
VGASAAEIDAAVRDKLTASSSLYNLNTALLRRLEPDLILTQDLCEVCSVDLNKVRAAAAALSAPPAILSLNPRGLEDIFDDILRIGGATGLARRATDALVNLRERLFRAADFVNPYLDGPSIACLEWTDPLFIGGHWTPQLIERAGARHPLNPTKVAENSGAAAGPQSAQRLAGKSIRIPPEALVATKPEALIICPCGIALPQVRAMAQDLARQPWWPELPAVKNRRVALVDGNQMFNRPGPRLIDAFEWLVGWLNDRHEIIPPEFPWESAT